MSSVYIHLNNEWVYTLDEVKAANCSKFIRKKLEELDKTDPKPLLKRVDIEGDPTVEALKEVLDQIVTHGLTDRISVNGRFHQAVNVWYAALCLDVTAQREALATHLKGWMKKHPFKPYDIETIQQIRISNRKNEEVKRFWTAMVNRCAGRINKNQASERERLDIINTSKKWPSLEEAIASKIDDYRSYDTLQAGTQQAGRATIPGPSIALHAPHPAGNDASREQSHAQPPTQTSAFWWQIPQGQYTDHCAQGQGD